jgi:hypothetical protein
MYQKIKALADEAIALQNKTRMDAVLRQISALCTPGAVMLIDGEYRTSVPPLTPEAGRSIDAAYDELKSERKAEEEFGLARLKMEGCAAHPDDVDADMTPEQEARQLAAYERDVAKASTKKGAKK